MRWIAVALTFLGFAGTVSAQPYDIIVAGRESLCVSTAPPEDRIAEWVSVPRAWRTVERSIAVVAPASRGRVFAVSDEYRAAVVELRSDAARVQVAGVPPAWSAEALSIDRAGNMYLLAMKDFGDLSLLVYNTKGSLLFIYPMGSDFLLSNDATAMDLAADQCTLLMAAKGGVIRRFNVCTGGFESDFGTAVPGEIADLRILPDGGVLIAGSRGLLRYSPAGTLLEEHTPSSAPLAITLTHGGSRVMMVGETCEPRVLEIDLATWSEKSIANIQQDLPMSIVPYFAWTAALGEAHLSRRRSARH